MNPGNVYAFDSQTAFQIPENPLRFEAFSNFLRTTRDLGTEFSLIGREMGLQPQVRFRVVLEGTSQLLDPLVYEHAYRIGREALLNAFRHSQASRIELHLAYNPKELRLTIRDNGQGMSADSVYLGCNGLSWMKTMAERISATLRLLSRARAGTEVFLSIPGEIAFLRKTKPHWQAAVA
jgi:signal transduction histidine kinase